MLKVCAYCGTEYKTYHSNSKFCSKACNQKNQDKRIQKVCEYCNEGFMVHAYRANTVRFCSSDCRKAACYRLGYDGENLFCSKCKKTKPLSEFFTGRSECKKCCSVRQKSYYVANKEKIMQKNNTYKESRKAFFAAYKRQHRKQNRERYNNLRKEWIINNGEHFRKVRMLYEQKRRAIKRHLPAAFSTNDWERALIYFSNACAYCGATENLEQEHVVPVIKEGAYSKENIIPACGDCNRSKGARDLFEWYEQSINYTQERLIHIIEYFLLSQ